MNKNSIFENKFREHLQHTCSLRAILRSKLGGILERARSNKSQLHPQWKTRHENRLTGYRNVECGCSPRKMAADRRRNSSCGGVNRCKSKWEIESVFLLWKWKAYWKRDDSISSYFRVNRRVRSQKTLVAWIKRDSCYASSRGSKADFTRVKRILLSNRRNHPLLLFSIRSPFVFRFP